MSNEVVTEALNKETEALLTKPMKKARAQTAAQKAAFDKVLAANREKAAAKKLEQKEFKEIANDEMQLRKELYQLDKARQRWKNDQLREYIKVQKERMQRGLPVQPQPEFNSDDEESESESEPDASSSADNEEEVPPPPPSRQTRSIIRQPRQDNVPQHASGRIGFPSPSRSVSSGRSLVRFSVPEASEAPNIFAD